MEVNVINNQEKGRHYGLLGTIISVISVLTTVFIWQYPYIAVYFSPIPRVVNLSHEGVLKLSNGNVFYGKRVTTAAEISNAYTTFAFNNDSGNNSSLPYMVTFRLTDKIYNLDTDKNNSQFLHGTQGVNEPNDVLRYYPGALIRVQAFTVRLRK